MFETIGLGILLILGIALCFFGKRILETVAFLIGAIAGAALAMVLAPNLHQFVDQYLNAEQCLIIGIIIGAIIGGYLGKRLMYGMISFLVATTVSYTVNILTGDPFYTLVAFFITLVIMWFLVEKFLAVITAFLGASMVGSVAMSGLLMFIDDPFIGFIVFLLVTAALTVFGARYQLE
jgi:hypothetical protein